jgi:hypothetical protein
MRSRFKETNHAKTDTAQTGNIVGSMAGFVRGYQRAELASGAHADGGARRSI